MMFDASCQGDGGFFTPFGFKECNRCRKQKPTKSLIWRNLTLLRRITCTRSSGRFWVVFSNDDGTVFFFDESGSPWWWTLPLHGSDLNDQGWVQGGVASCHMKCILWLITRPLVPPAWFNHFVEVFLMKATTLDDCFLTGCLGNRQPPRTARSSTAKACCRGCWQKKTSFVAGWRVRWTREMSVLRIGKDWESQKRSLS